MERWTMEYLEWAGNRQLIKDCIRARRDCCVNPNAPLYKRLTQLLEWVDENVDEPQPCPRFVSKERTQ